MTRRCVNLNLAIFKNDFYLHNTFHTFKAASHSKIFTEIKETKVVKNCRIDK